MLELLQKIPTIQIVSEPKIEWDDYELEPVQSAAIENQGKRTMSLNPGDVCLCTNSEVPDHGYQHLLQES